MRRGQLGIVARLGWLEGSRLGVRCTWPCERGLLLAVAILEFWVLLRWYPLLRWVGSLALQAASKSWSELCLRHHWNVAQYFATLPGHRWIKRILAWQPAGHKRVGRPKYCWDTMLTNFCRLKGLVSWKVIATDAEFWNLLLPEFFAFNLPHVM